MLEHVFFIATSELVLSSGVPRVCWPQLLHASPYRDDEQDYVL